MNIILYAIPFFFLLIGIELAAEAIKRSGYYRVNDAINSLSMGLLSRMTGIIKQVIPITLYVLVYENFAMQTLPDTIWTWIAVFVLYDFFYYWNHRLGHEMSILWAAHVVHHSSEDYNLTTALRQTSGSIFSWIFYLPLALFGFEPIMVISVGAINLVYQFWVHTRHVPKLGWYEWVFVTPSNHRVHHAQNQIYIDRNYGGVFIIWDRMFGSFQEELESDPPIYGIRKALHSWNPLWANIQVYSQLFKDSWRTAKLADKFKVWFGRTGWRPADVERDFPLPRVDLSQFQKYHTVLNLSTKLYCIGQYTITAIIGVMFMMTAAQLATHMQLLVAAGLIYSMFSVGMLMDQKAYGVAMESAKNIIMLALLFFLPFESWLFNTVLIGTLISLFLLALSVREGNSVDHKTAVS
jgi:alkylglycerol monooxygenase